MAIDEKRRKQVELELQKWICVAFVDTDMIADANIKTEVLYDFMTDEILARFTIRAPTEDLRRIVCEWPRDWWQAFKERWFPKWLKSHFPICYAREELVARAMYPLVSCSGLKPVIMLDGGQEIEAAEPETRNGICQ